MKKSTQYAFLGTAVAAVVALTIWDASADLERYKSAPPGNATGHAAMEHGDRATAETPDTQNLTAYQNGENALMSAMMNGMENIPLSGSAAADFLTGMIPHHEAAIAMAELYRQSGGRHPVLTELAETVIVTQTKEISQMNAILQRLRDLGVKDEREEAAYLEAYRRMMAGHHAGHDPAGRTVDEAFAQGMIEHHQMAVDMARIILNHTDDAELRTLAQDIVAAQEAEIRRMQETLAPR